MDTESLAHPHPSTDEHDDTVEAHYSGLERFRPCACIDGLVFVGYIDEDGEEREAAYLWRRCATPRLIYGPEDLLSQRESVVYEPQDVCLVVLDLPGEQSCVPEASST